MLRLRAAVNKLREGGATIETVLTESGFSSTRTFYRAFAAEFGCSPKKYLQGEN